MNFDLKFVITMYIILIVLLYLYKSDLFDLDVQNKNKKMIYLMFLLFILAVISFYAKVIFECFFSV